jgi:hypothetical protein
MKTDSTVAELLSAFLAPRSGPKGNSPEQVKARIEHWIDVANNPEFFVNDKNPFELTHRRRMARQNLRRLCKKYPMIAELVRRERAAAINSEAA